MKYKFDCRCKFAKAQFSFKIYFAALRFSFQIYFAALRLIFVQNLFCSFAIFVQNLFCGFAIFVPNLFCIELECKIYFALNFCSKFITIKVQIDNVFWEYPLCIPTWHNSYFIQSGNAISINSRLCSSVNTV